MAGLEVWANVVTIIEFLLTKFQFLKEYFTSPDLTKDLVTLEDVVLSIPDLLRVGAESRYAHASGVSPFVRQLKQLDVDAKVLVDELKQQKHKVLVDELKQQKQQDLNNSKFLTKLLGVLPWFLNKVIGVFAKESPPITVVTRERIQNLIEELNRVIHGLKGAIDVADKLPPSVSPTTTVTTSTIDPRRVGGREEEKQQMMEFLRPYPLIHDQKVSFFAITGIEGVGKTTLAKHAFNDLKDRFHLNAWVYVSNAFDRKRLLQEIIEEITGASCNITSINTLESTIKKKVKYKTVLLVLDDVWSTQWMDLLPPLQFSEAKCCKVIVTAREVNNIPQIHDYESRMLPLVRLQGEEN